MLLRRKRCVACDRKTWFPTLHFVGHVLNALIPDEIVITLEGKGKTLTGQASDERTPIQ